MRRTLTIMIGVVLFLSAVGIVMLTSTSSVTAAASKLCNYDAYYFVKRQSLYLCLGLVAMAAAYLINYRHWRRYVLFVAIGSLVLLAMAATPGVGLVINGSRRWLRAGSLTIQPSEMAKFAVIVLLAWWMSRRTDRAGTIAYGLVGAGALLLCYVGLIAVEPDFGTTILCACTGLAVMFIGGSPPGPLLLSSVAGGFGLGYVIMHNPNRMERILAFLDPDKYEETYAYQLRHAEYAFVAGGFQGVGFGQSLQKQFYLPEAYADFIFPIIGEERGLPASLGILILFVVFFVCGLRISFAAPDLFGRLVAFGITTVITLQAAFNIAVVTGCVPTKGLPLPFISYGGTSLIVTLGMVGVLANIARETDIDRSQHLFAIKDRARHV